MAKKDPLQPERCAELLSALAAPERLSIVRFLSDGPKNVTQIVEAIRIPPLNVSHHLTKLKMANIIQSKKSGRFVHYFLSDGILEQINTSGTTQDALNLGCCQIVLPVSAE